MHGLKWNGKYKQIYQKGLWELKSALLMWIGHLEKIPKQLQESLKNYPMVHWEGFNTRNFKTKLAQKLIELGKLCIRLERNCWKDASELSTINKQQYRESTNSCTSCIFWQFIPIFLALYRKFLCVWCHFIILSREKAMCLTAQPPISQFCLPWWVTWPLFLNRSHVLIHLPSSFQLCYFHQVVFLYVDKIILDFKLFLMNLLDIYVLFFIKINIARGESPPNQGC